MDLRRRDGILFRFQGYNAQAKRVFVTKLSQYKDIIVENVTTNIWYDIIILYISLDLLKDGKKYYYSFNYLLAFRVFLLFISLLF